MDLSALPEQESLLNRLVVMVVTAVKEQEVAVAVAAAADLAAQYLCTTRCHWLLTLRAAMEFGRKVLVVWAALAAVVQVHGVGLEFARLGEVEILASRAALSV